jgi:DNA-binding transcriptional regulator GbsR (MarR family)
MGCHGWQVKLIKSSRVKEIKDMALVPRSCCQGDRKILVYMKKTYKTKKTRNARNFVDDIDPSKNKQIKYYHENDNIHLQILYI